jgi:predicted nuclease of predicted toxin-antitoxin system
MRFLVDADLPRSVVQLLTSYGHTAVDVRDIGFGDAKDSLIAAHAQTEGYCFITGDFHFADVRNYPPREYSGLVVLNLPGTATASYILHLLETFLMKKELVSRMARKLAIVEPGRVRIRS